MIPTFENGGLQVLFALIGLALAVFFFAKWQSAVQYQRRKREHELAERKRKKLLDHQLNLGNRLHSSLLSAAHNNRKADKIAVQVIGQNGNLGYSILVGWREGSSYTFGDVGYRGYPVVQVNVNLEKIMPINVSLGPYPNPADNTYREYTTNEDEVRAMIYWLNEYVTGYSPTRTNK